MSNEAIGMSSKIVTVFGGSGFLGRHVVQALARRGYRVRPAVRRPDLAGFLQPLGMVGQVMPVQANLRYPWSVDKAAEGASAVVNLVGILAAKGRQTFEAVQDAGARAVAAAAAKHGASLVQVSSLGATPDGKTAYQRTKAAGEAAALAEVPGAVVFRPSVVFGPEDDFFNRFAGLARLMPVMPLIGEGVTRFQPVFVGDVTAGLLELLKRSDTAGKTYEFGGPQVYSFKALLELLLSALNRQRILLPIPFALAEMQAGLLELLPNPPLTRDQVRLLKTDKVVSGMEPTLGDLGVRPRPLEEFLAGFKEKYG